MEQVAIRSNDELEELIWLGQYHLTYIVVILGGEKLSEDVRFDSSIEQVIENRLIIFVLFNQIDGDVDKHYEVLLTVIGDEVLDFYFEVHCMVIEPRVLINCDTYR